MSLKYICMTTCGCACHFGLLLNSYSYIYLLCFTQIRPLGRNTRGAGAMKLKEGDKMAAMDIIPAAVDNMPESYSSR
jgi:hypothetical protein